MNPYFTDIIGENIEIEDASDKRNVGIKGIVVNETKNTITLRNNANRMIQKRYTVIKINGKLVKMDDILFRPEEKIKKIRRRGKI